MNLLDFLKQNPFVLAPMAGVTDNAFRSFMKDLGCSINVTELISAHALVMGDKKTFNLAKFESHQSPIGVQIFGHDPDVMKKAAIICEHLGFDFIDINMGCPVKKITSKGSGSALLKDLNLTTKIISNIKSSISIPLTIKIRSGWDENSKNALELCNIAHNEGVTWVCLHGRTRSQAFTGEADWDYIKFVSQNSKVPVIGNGDIKTAKQANECLGQYDCSGVMIGRGCLKRPNIFKEALDIFANKPSLELDHKQMLDKLYEKLYLYLPKEKILIQLKKFVTWFSSGYPESAQFRKEVFRKKTISDVINYCDEFFVKSKQEAQVLGGGFMMSGHG